MNIEEYVKLYDDPFMYDQWDIGPDHERSRFMLAHVKGPKVLEFGCGGSGFTRLLVERGFKCTAVDVNPKWIALGRERLPSVQYIHSLVEEFVTGERYDSIIVMEILEHVLNPTDMLNKAISLLNPNGRILITVPKAGGPWDHTDNHLRQYTKEMLIEDIDVAKALMGRINVNIWEEGFYLYGVMELI